MKMIVTSILLTFCFTLQAQHTNEITYDGNFFNAKQYYSGKIALDEVLEDILSYHEPEVKKRTITISIPLVSNSNVLSKNIDALPLDLSEEELARSKRTVTISMPFELNEFLEKNQGANTFDFASHVSDFVKKHQVIDGSNTKGLGDPLNQSNCGGYSLGSTIVDKKDIGCLGTVTNTYTCQTDPTTGGRSWYLTKSLHEASTECIIGPE